MIKIQLWFLSHHTYQYDYYDIYLNYLYTYFTLLHLTYTWQLGC